MNNIQKAFKNKAKCGLRMAVGGVIEPALVDQQAIKAGTVDPNGSDFDTINAERTLRWAADDAASAQKHRQPFAPTMAATDLAKGLLSQPQSAQPAQPVQAAQPAASADTTFEQDMNARDARIRGYGKGLGRSYADGGVIQETPDQIMERMSAKYGLPAAGPVKPAQAPVQQAAPQPPAQQQQKPGLMDRLRNVATGNLEGRMRAAGMAEGGIVRGKGGPTDDEVPMNVGGVDVNLSNKEAVLPAKTVEALGGTEAVEDMIEITNGKPPVRHGLRAGGEYAEGNVFTVDQHGNVVDPESARPALPPPRPQVAPDPKAFTVDPHGNAVNPSAPRLALPNPNPAPVQAPPVAPSAGAAPSAWKQAVDPAAWQGRGKAVGDTLNNARAGLRGTAAPIAGAALSAGAELLDKDQSDLFNDPTVPTTDKLRQMGRVTLRNAGGLAGGTIAGTAGTVVGGPLVGVPAAIAGGAAGYVGGNKLGEAIFGDPIADRKGRAATAQRAVHDAIMGGQDSGKFDLPKIDKAGAAKDLAAAQKQGRFQFGDDDPNVMGLRAAGVTGAITGDTVDPKTGRTAATGIRTIDGANGQKIYAGRDKNGQLNVSSGAGTSQAESDAARDAAFEKAGTKKDAYGNWLSPQRLGDKAALAQMQQERTLRDAFDPSITDPNVQSNARARLGYDLAGQQVAAKGGLEQARLILDKARFDREGKQQDREQANKDKEFEFKDNEAHTKRISDLIENWAGDPKAPDYAQKVAQLHAYAGNFKRQKGQDSNAHISELMKNKAYDDFVNAKGQHWFTPQMEQTGQPVMPKAETNTGLRSALEGAFVSKNRYKDANTNQTIYDSDIATMPKELREIHKQRLAATQTR